MRRHADQTPSERILAQYFPIADYRWGSPTATAAFDIRSAKIKIDTIDAQFAPSVERLDIRYTITPVGTNAPFARIEIFKKGDTNPIFRDSISPGGTNQYSQGWDGIANLGPDSGKFIGPEGSPYEVQLSIADNAGFSNNKSDRKKFKIETFVETALPAAPPKPGASPTPGSADKEYNVIKPWNPNTAVTELNTEITLKVLYLSKNGSKVGTAIPIKVDWSFTNPDDTAGDRDIDTNQGSGDDNATIAEGGKRGTGAQHGNLWKAVAGFNSLIDSGGQIASSDVSTIPGPNVGTTKIEFSRRFP